jgi:hypothetical protein
MYLRLSDIESTKHKTTDSKISPAFFFKDLSFK